MNIKTLQEAGRAVKPYRPSPPVSRVASGLDCEVLKLNSNENLFLGEDVFRPVLREAAWETDPRLYPQEEEDRLIAKISQINKVEQGQVMVTAGGDQLIELLFSLLKTGDKVTAVTPTFSMYPRAAKQRGVQLVEVPLNPDFTLDLSYTLEQAEGSELLVVCNPNNPTGNQFPREQVVKLIESFDGLVLLDEAYQEYGAYSLADRVRDFDNLMILRTFSKAYGLAGLRLGYCIADDKLVSTLRTRFMMPYPVANFVLNAGFKILERNQAIIESVEKAKAERDWLISELDKVPGVKVYPSDACFVLFKTEAPYSEVYDSLLKRGVIISKQSNVLGSGYLRVTVAPRAMLERFIEALREATR